MISLFSQFHYHEVFVRVYLVKLFMFNLFPVLQMVILYKDPRGEFIFNRGMSQMQITNTGMSLNDSEREKLRDLEVHCRDIENRLSKYEVNIISSCTLLHVSPLSP